MFGRNSSNDRPSGHHNNSSSKKPAHSSHTPPTWNLPGPPPPPPPPPPAPASYNPSTYGPMPGAVPIPNAAARLSPALGAVDTSKWGVRYNQQHHQPPPLPPRPSSSGSPAQGSGQPSTEVSTAPSSPPWNAPQISNQKPVTSPTIQGNGSPPLPPPPPPIPHGYKAELQHVAQTLQQQQQRPLTHQYSPIGQSPPANATSYAQSEDYDPKPPSPSTDRPLPPLPVEIAAGLNAVSPVSFQQPTFDFGSQQSTNVPSGEMRQSALGDGAPSDWEHFSPVDDTDNSPTQHHTNEQHVIPSPVTKIGSSTSNISAKDRPLGADGAIHPGTTYEPSEASRGSTDKQQSAEESEPAAAQNEGTSLTPISPRDDATESNTHLSAVQKKLPDPYESLDPWFQSSLARYVTMLRKEAVAETDEEKYKIFTTFVAKETKLREILYNIDPSSAEDAKSISSPEPGQISRSKSVEPSVRTDSELIPADSEGDSDRPHIPRISTAPPEVASDETQEDAYSPGGRPILSVHLPSTVADNKHKLRRSVSHSTASANRDGSNILRSTTVPPESIDNPWKSGTETPLISNPPQSIYTPFRYAEGPQRGSDNLNFDRPAYQAYSALRQASADSGRTMSHTPAPTSRGRSGTIGQHPAHEHDETFLGLIREKSVTYRKKRAESTPPLPLLPDGIRQGKFDVVLEELGSLIPEPFPENKESLWIAATRKDIRSFSDDFRYIKETVEKWERSAKDRHEQLDKERMARQEESEQHIDALFNDNEIGYADINTLEDDFRHAEAKKQLEEERKELEKFIEEVYNPLDECLKSEISQLSAHYKLTVDELDLGDGGSKEPTSDRFQVSHIMKLVNDIYLKLELRYQKRLEIALDRERRRKKAERRPLIFMGDSPALRKLDGEFDSMERRNILEAANERDERANILMDSFDTAIMRGLGENQSVLDNISAKMKKLDPKTISHAGLAQGDIERILKSTYALVKFLEANSESILRSFGDADSLLNDADYSVSVAEARYSNADSEVFRRLDEEKKKEDAKIEQELNSKLETVREGPAKLTAKIDGLLEALGKESGPGTGPWSRPEIENTNTAESDPAEVLRPGPRPASAAPSGRRSDADPEQQERLRKALEDAKRRNAARQQH
ncbi:hypothetical protein NFIA_025380 [Paecilomyces variotii No. 5]|uniref:Uncharacterized protein n=1 Tax=Byssochlamys spectabilis (strain No. 5 / NBRC 109023) TaxID=1356009 RepID=V5I280_BYSSN|nr:hypothetical protein NFIA_025380 [Paecilomyces variotii No. 5]